MKYVLFIIALLGLGGLIVLWSDTTTQTDPIIDVPVATTTSATTTENGTTNEWVQTQATASMGLRFGLEHPPAATLTQAQSNIFELKYIGPNSEPNTEITDGYYVSLRFATGTLETYLAENSDTTADITTTTIGGYPAQQFTTESELGSMVTHYVLTVGYDKVLDIGVTVAGANVASYRDTVQAILDTLTVSDNTADADNDGSAVVDLIRLTAPTAGATISSPVTITGEARGQWFFEATAPVIITDWDGRIIGEGYIEAGSDWMTESFVPFSGEVKFDTPTDEVSDRGSLILQRANPSGLPENDAALEITVRLE